MITVEKMVLKQVENMKKTKLTFAQNSVIRWGRCLLNYVVDYGPDEISYYTARSWSNNQLQIKVYVKLLWI